jgi:hypothetical protein
MPAAQQRALDGRKVADLVALLDSPVDAEASLALHRIRVLKTKLGGIPFYALMEAEDYKAAAWVKYGGCAAPCGSGASCHHGPESLRGYFERKHGAGGGADLAEAQKQIDALKTDNAQLAKGGAALAAALKQRDETIDALRVQAAQPTARTVAGTAGPAGEYAAGLFAFMGVMGIAALLFAAIAALTGS